MVRRSILLLLVACVIGVGAALWLLQNSISNVEADLTLPAGKEWLAPGGDLHNTRYSTLDQLTPANVKQLKGAWVVHLGSGLGAWIGSLLATRAPSLGVDARVAGLVGMAAIFAGASHALLTAVVFAFETTRQPVGLLPLLAGCTASYLVALLINRHSIMTEKLARRGLNVRPEYSIDYLSRVFVSSVGVRDVVTLRATMTMPSSAPAHATCCEEPTSRPARSACRRPAPKSRLPRGSPARASGPPRCRRTAASRARSAPSTPPHRASGSR